MGVQFLGRRNKYIAVPTATRDDTKASAYNYSSVGIRNFHPWFVADANPAQNDEYFGVIMDILALADDNIEKEEYWFFRGDVNVLMMFYRVCSCVFIVSSFWMVQMV